MTTASVTRMLGNIRKGLRIKAQIDFLKSAPKVAVSKRGFNELGIAGLLAMKSIVVYDRARSRDIYDLMVLTRDHGYTLDDVLTAIDAYQPIRHKDPEHFNTVLYRPKVNWLERDKEVIDALDAIIAKRSRWGFWKC